MTLNKVKRVIYENQNPRFVLIPSKDLQLMELLTYIERKLTNPQRHRFQKDLLKFKVCFIRFYSPADININLPFRYNHVISIDYDFLQTVFNDNLELIFPIVLHEIGHLFNIPKKQDLNSNDGFNEFYNEGYADDFVRDLGFETELLISLEHYKKWKEDNNTTVDKLFQYRIDRIKNKENPYHKIQKGINIDSYNRKRIRELKKSKEIY